MKYGASFQFEGGSLAVRRSGYGEKNGGATLAFKDSDLEYDFDRSDTATRWIEIGPSEVIAIRDFLNKEFPPDPPSPEQKVEQK